MNRAGLQRFFVEWWPPIFLAMFAVMMLGTGLLVIDIRRQTRSIVREEQVIVGAKQRLAVDRQTILDTRQKVQQIEERLFANKVPDRLERIEKSIGTAVSENRRAIDSLDARQRKITDKLEMVLGIPREEIDEPNEPEAPRP
jgi:hypothetical protein